MDHFCYWCFMFIMFSCSLVVTCWEGADLLALLCVMFNCVCISLFPMWCPGVLDCIGS